MKPLEITEALSLRTLIAVLKYWRTLSLFDHYRTIIRALGALAAGRDVRLCFVNGQCWITVGGAYYPVDIMFACAYKAQCTYERLVSAKWYRKGVSFSQTDDFFEHLQRPVVPESKYGVQAKQLAYIAATTDASKGFSVKDSGGKFVAVCRKLVDDLAGTYPRAYASWFPKATLNPAILRLQPDPATVDYIHQRSQQRELGM